MSLDNIPPDLVEKVRRKNSLNLRRSKAQSSIYEKKYAEEELVQRVLHLDSKTINYGQREKLCASLLLGDYDVLEKNPQSHDSTLSVPSVNALPPGLTKTLAHLKRHGHKHRFLEVESSKLSLHPISPTSFVSNEKTRQAGLGRKPPIYTWAGQSLQAQPPMSSPRKLSASVDGKPKTNINILKRAKLAEAIHSAKMEVVKKDAEEVRRIRGFVEKKRAEETEAASQKYTVRKKLTSFREKLKERLRERQDPQMGAVMRCIDERAIHTFLSSHKGYNMSVDAILASVGTSLHNIEGSQVLSSANLNDPDELFEARDGDGVGEGEGGGEGSGGYYLSRKLLVDSLAKNAKRRDKDKPVIYGPHRYFRRPPSSSELARRVDGSGLNLVGTNFEADPNYSGTPSAAATTSLPPPPSPSPPRLSYGGARGGMAVGLTVTVSEQKPSQSQSGVSGSVAVRGNGSVTYLTEIPSKTTRLLEDDRQQKPSMILSSQSSELSLTSLPASSTSLSAAASVFATQTAKQSPVGAPNNSNGKSNGNSNSPFRRSIVSNQQHLSSKTISPSDAGNVGGNGGSSVSLVSAMNDDSSANSLSVGSEHPFPEGSTKSSQDTEDYDED